MERKKREDFHDDFGYECYIDELIEEIRNLTLQNKYLLAQRANQLEDSRELDSLRQQRTEDLFRKQGEEGVYG